MAMAGWKTDEMLEGLDGIMNLAAASGEDLGTTSDIVTDALTAFGESAGESGRLADIMAAASSNANTNVSMMGETFKYAAPIAGALGYSMEDTAVAIGLMANNGIKASQAGTSLRSGLTRLAAPTKQASEAMDKYGISLTDADGNMLSFHDLMIQLREKLGDLSETEQTAAANALFGKNAMSGWLAVINSSDEDFDKLTTAIDNSDGAAQRMAETMQDNLSGKLTILGSAVEGLGIALYEYISGPLQSAVEFFTGVITGITELVSPHKTELETFIDDIGKANDQVAKSIEHANETIEDGEAKAAEIEVYKGVLDGVLESCEQYNLITLDDGTTAITDSSGKVVKSFTDIDSAVEGTKTLLQDFGATGYVDLTGVAEGFEDVGDSVKTTYKITDEFTKLKISNMVDTLGGSVEGLADAWNEQTGTLTASRGELEKWFNTAKEVAMYEALQSAMDELNQAWGEAAVSLAQANSAVSAALEDLNKDSGQAFKTAQDAIEWITDPETGYAGKFSDVLNEAVDAQIAANDVFQEAEANLTSTQEALEPLKERLEATMGAAQEAALSGEDAAAAVADLGDESEDAAEDVGKLTQKEQEVIDKLAEFYGATDNDLADVRNLLGMSNSDFAEWAAGVIDNIEEVQKAYDDFYKTVLENNTGFLNTYTKDGETIEQQVENFTSSLYAQRDEFKRWVAGMKILGEMVSRGEFSQDLYDEFLKAGAKGNAGFIEGLAGNPGAAAEATVAYNDNVIAAATATEELMKYSSAGQAHAAVMGDATVEGLYAKAEAYKQAGSDTAQNVAAGITDNSQTVTDAATTTVTEANTAATTEAENAKAAGEQAATSTKEGIEETKSEVTAATETMIEEANKAGEVIAAKFNVTGQMIPQELKKGIEAIKDNEYVGSTPAARKMAEAMVSAVSDKYQDFVQSGKNSAIGVANGINAESQTAIDAAVDLANAVNNAYNNTLIIRSPSKRMEKSGKQTVEGVVVGIKDEAPKAKQAAQDAAEEVALIFETAGKAATDPEADKTAQAMLEYARRAENLVTLANEKTQLSKHYQEIANNNRAKADSSADDIQSAMYALQSQVATATRYRLKDELDAELESYKTTSAESLEKTLSKLTKSSTKASSQDSGLDSLSALTDSAMSSLSAVMDKTRRTTARIRALTAGISDKLDKIISGIGDGLDVAVYVGNEQLDARTVRVVKKAINTESKALKASKGRW